MARAERGHEAADPQRTPDRDRRDASADDPRRQLAAAAGNRMFSQALARAGAGLMPDGTVHPSVQAAIASASAGGSKLDATVRERFAGPLGDPMADVRVHADTEADELARSVSARAFTVGSDVFVAAGEYRPGTPSGDHLLAHELTHVVQQRGASATGPLVVSEPGDAQEREADAAADELSS